MAKRLYALVCIATQKKYVGTTGNVAKRYREHRSLLNRGLHAEPLLQADWAKLGEKAFWLQPFQELPEGASVAEVRKAEVDLMDILAPVGLLYNTRHFAYQPPPGASAKAVKARVASGYRPSKESNQKRRAVQLGIPKGHGAKISATKRRKRDEIVSSAGKINLQGPDKEPGH